MAILLASIAFVLSMAALWFACELTKRTDGGAKMVVKPHLATFNQALSRAEAQIQVLSRDLEVAQREIKILRAEQGTQHAMPTAAPTPQMGAHGLNNAAAFTPSATYNA